MKGILNSSYEKKRRQRDKEISKSSLLLPMIVEIKLLFPLSSKEKESHLALFLEKIQSNHWENPLYKALLPKEKTALLTFLYKKGGKTLVFSWMQRAKVDLSFCKTLLFQGDTKAAWSALLFYTKRENCSLFSAISSLFLQALTEERREMIPLLFQLCYENTPYQDPGTLCSYFPENKLKELIVCSIEKNAPLFSDLLFEETELFERLTLPEKAMLLKKAVVSKNRHFLTFFLRKNPHACLKKHFFANLQGFPSKDRAFLEHLHRHSPPSFADQIATFF